VAVFSDKATHLARLSYIFGKLRHVAIQKYMIEIAPKYGTNRSKSGTRLKDYNSIIGMKDI
jgi:hypothetical protein